MNLVAEIAAEAREEGFGFCAAMKELARRVSACPSSWGFGYKTKSIRDRLIDEAGLGRGARKLTSDEIGNAEARERYASRFGGPYTLHVADCRRGHGKTRDGGPFRKPHHLEAWVKDYIHDDPQNAAFVQGLFGYLPSVTTMCRWLRAEYGRKAEINRIGNCKPYLQTRGVRGNRIAGYYFELDAAGQPCVFGANEVGSRRDKDNKTHRWVYLARDAESGRIIIGGRGGVSESPGWPDFIEHLLCHELKYAPAVIQSDQVAGLFGQAPELAPGGPCPLSDTALLLLACEVQAVVSQGESPTSKARVERSVGIYRTHADGYFAARQAERDRAIEAGRETRLEAMRYRFIENETAFVLNFLPDVQRRIDEQLINGTGKTALELCSGPASVAWRKTRELVDDPMEVFRRDIQPGIRVGAVGGGVVEWKEKGYSRAFKLTAAEDFKADGSQVCIIIPAGMLKAHTPGRAFIYVIRRGKSNGFTIALAGTCGMILDQYGKGDAQPTILQGFAGKPWDEEARRAFKRDKARRAHTDRQRELIAEARARRDGDVPNIGDFAPSAPLPAVATGTIDAAPLPAGEEGGADGR
ncbi:MAG: hypothetical protein NTW87_09880 [Planctomycetota bacterium]|nr:hypothetical protein [Planctomycetota bacterium]